LSSEFQYSDTGVIDLVCSESAAAVNHVVDDLPAGKNESVLDNKLGNFSDLHVFSSSRIASVLFSAIMSSGLFGEYFR
jgi:hypothetical protein